jgi:hypothetical protein
MPAGTSFCLDPRRRRRQVPLEAFTEAGSAFGTRWHVGDFQREVGAADGECSAVAALDDGSAHLGVDHRMIAPGFGGTRPPKRVRTASRRSGCPGEHVVILRELGGGGSA